MEGNDWGNAWLVKVDKYGDTLWSKQYGGSSYDYGQYIDKTSDGGYILLGLTNGFSDSDSRDANDEVFLIKTDADGNEQWNNTYTAEMYSRANCVKEMSDNGFIMALSSVYTWPGESLLTFIRTDAFGNIVWTESMDFEKSESISKILMDEEFLYFIGSVGDNNYPHDVFVVKMSFEGEYLWDQSYGDENNQMAIDAVFSPAGNIVITGKTGSFPYNINALSISQNGDLINTQTFGSSYYEIPYAMSLIENNEIIIVGLVGTDEDKGDAFALKLTIETTEVEQIPWSTCFEFNFFPNPVKDKSTLYFELKTNSVVNLSVSDTYGREIATLFTGYLSNVTQQIDFNFSGFETGIYFVKLEAEDQVAVRKIVIAK